VSTKIPSVDNDRKEDWRKEDYNVNRAAYEGDLEKSNVNPEQNLKMRRRTRKMQFILNQGVLTTHRIGGKK